MQAQHTQFTNTTNIWYLIACMQYIRTVKPPISGPSIFGHLPQPHGCDLSNFLKDPYTLIKQSQLLLKNM